MCEIFKVLYNLGDRKSFIRPQQHRDDHSDVEIIVKMLNENDEILYTSPIISFLSPEVHFEIDSADVNNLKNSLQLKIAVEAIATKNHWDYADDLYIKNLIVVTTDY